MTTSSGVWLRGSLLATAMLSGLSPLGAYAATPEPNSLNSAQVYFYRTGSLPIWTAYFYVDGEKVADLAAGPCKYTSLRLLAGAHSLKHGWPMFQMATTFSRKLKLSVNWAPNGIYYYNLNYSISGGYPVKYITELAQVDTVVASEEIARCAYRPPLKGGSEEQSPSPPVAAATP
jgi:hypothetical protein